MASIGQLDLPEHRSAIFHDHAHRECAGMRIGSYALLQEIGEGGMANVWLAEQTRPVHRTGALKLIKPGLDSRQVLARFEAERQTLALMDHPNIAKVLDVGETANGRSYFVMELVNGPRITTYCDEHRLTLRQRLELFIPVCQAIQHAHQKGIIHRDIKPSNVMVADCDEKPLVKVIDFGVAKATGERFTEGTLSTELGTLIGTLEYMSPEQAELDNRDIDTRSDIYSLGVLLYELLTGTTPITHERLRQTSLSDLLRIIREEEPPKPSKRLSVLTHMLPSISAQRQTDPAKLTHSVHGELDWIVMKALDKDRNRRYESANSLARDIERYLRDEPVQACPPSAAYRFRKFARRNKRAIATATVVGIAILFAVGTLAGSIGWVSRDRAARHAAIEDEAIRGVISAERLRDNKAFAESLFEIKRAESLLAGVDSEEVRDRAGTVRADLDMVASLEEIRLQQGDSKVVNLAYQDADPAYAAAFASYGLDLNQLDPVVTAERVRVSSIRDELVIALDDWAWVKPNVDRAGRERVLTIARRADPDEWRNRLRDPSVVRNRESLEQLAARPEVASLPPTTTVLLGRMLDAAGATEQAISVLSAAHPRHPSDLFLNLELARLMRWRVSPPRWLEAAEYARTALALLRGARDCTSHWGTR
jgi:serine/threonine protein kinase